MFGTTSGYLYAVSGKTGRDIPKFPFRTHGRIAAPILITQLSQGLSQQLVVMSFDGHLYMVDGISGVGAEYNLISMSHAHSLYMACAILHCMCLLAHTLARSLARSPTHSLACSPSHSITQPPTHSDSCVRSLSRLLTALTQTHLRSFTYSSLAQAKSVAQLHRATHLSSPRLSLAASLISNCELQLALVPVRACCRSTEGCSMNFTLSEDRGYGHACRLRRHNGLW